MGETRWAWAAGSIARVAVMTFSNADDADDDDDDGAVFISGRRRMVSALCHDEKWSGGSNAQKMNAAAVPASMTFDWYSRLGLCKVIGVRERMGLGAMIGRIALCPTRHWLAFDTSENLFNVVQFSVPVEAVGKIGSVKNHDIWTSDIGHFTESESRYR
jgi:hypothetical protein